MDIKHTTRVAIDTATHYTNLIDHRVGAQFLGNLIYGRVATKFLQRILLRGL
ncbi:hypothetical protein [Kistimonas scapharcae]|uniref:hypothetical protein n=1 Tax=Kistimonas scapharcae TaxID=1036133 RepID=UPI0031E76E8A